MSFIPLRILPLLVFVWVASPAECARAAEVSSRQVLAQYANVVEAGYQDAHAAARSMQNAVKAFVAGPSTETLAQARTAWLAARDIYGQTEAFRFYGGPIDGANGPEGRINAWPLDEAYIDAVVGRANSGFVNDPRIRLDARTLISLNEKAGEENISTGWHAIEFMLWGQDLSTDGPGARPWTDFADGKALNADRRRRYLTVVTELLVDDLASLVRAWAPAKDNYRARFVTSPGNVGKVLTGMGVLTRGELAGERLEVALDSQSQEDEHSCLFDNTHRDIVANALGIRNVWRGEYKRADGTMVTGPGLRDLVAAKDAKVAERVDTAMDNSLAAARAIPPPFDRAIQVGSPGRSAVEATVAALKIQATSLVDAAAALGIKRLETSVPK